MRCIERRIAAELNLVVHSVASIFVSRWNKAVEAKVPLELRNQLGIAVASRTYKVYLVFLTPIAGYGSKTREPGRRDSYGPARAPKILKHPISSTIKALAVPYTVNTIPEPTLLAFAQHGEVREMLAADGGNGEELLARFAHAGIVYDALATKLQREGAESFEASWNDLMDGIASKGKLLTNARITMQREKV